MNNIVNTAMETLIDKIFSPNSNHSSPIRKLSGSQSLLQSSSSMFQHIPNECHQELFENSLFASDFSVKSPMSESKFNFQPFFKAFSPTASPLVVPKLSPTKMHEQVRLLSSPMNVMFDINPNLSAVCGSPTKKPMESKEKNDSIPQPIAGEFKISLSTSPVKSNSINITVTKKPTKPNEPKSTTCDFSVQLANRKIKELQKRSKKKRRRQKKGNVNQNSQPNNDTSNSSKCDFSTNSSSPKVNNQKKNCDIICDVTISHDSEGKISSFIVTVDSADDDSDWDTNNDVGWQADESEFQFGGLFVASFSAPNLCANAFNDSNSEVNCDKEQDVNAKKLREVNRLWNETTKCLQGKVKSKALVSFATEDDLVEVFPVEMYERKGEWEIYATERLRFKKRIKELEVILSPCLLPQHREKMYQNLHKTVL